MAVGSDGFVCRALLVRRDRALLEPACHPTARRPHTAAGIAQSALPVLPLVPWARLFRDSWPGHAIRPAGDRGEHAGRTHVEARARPVGGRRREAHVPRNPWPGNSRRTKRRGRTGLRTLL